MAEDQLTGGVMYPRTVGGDHKSTDAEIIADLGNVDMVAAGSKNKVDALLRQQLQRFFGVRCQGVLRGQQSAI
ncbi:hypothetical protein D3C80_2046330 [compost metagenome]